MTSERTPDTRHPQTPERGATGSDTAAERHARPASTASLLADIGRRFRLRYGRIEVVFHDGRPSPRVTVEHRVIKELDDQ